MPVHKIMRPAREISRSGFVNIDSHVMVKRREDLLEMHRPVVGFAAQAVGRNYAFQVLSRRPANLNGLESTLPG